MHTEYSNMSHIPEGRRRPNHYKSRYPIESSLRQTPSQSRSFTSQRYVTRDSYHRVNGRASPIPQSGSSNQRRLTLPSHNSPLQLHNIVATRTEKDQTSDSQRSKERRSALERIAEPDLRDQLQVRGSPSREPARLQEVEILYENTTPQDNTLAVRSSVNTPPPTKETGQSSNRTPASQRLGGLSTLGSRERTREALANAIAILVEVSPTTSRVATRRTTIKITPKSRVARSTRTGAKLKRASTTRTTNPPRKKTLFREANLPHRGYYCWHQ